MEGRADRNGLVETGWTAASCQSGWLHERMSRLRMKRGGCCEYGLLELEY
jgi:hypothetical protein